MRIDAKTAHVCLGDNEVKVGDKVTFVNYECDGDLIGTSGLASACKNTVAGEVYKTLGLHYSTIKTNGSLEFKEGTLVQKN